MAVFELRSPLTAEERTQKRRLILRDSISLFTLFLITAALAVLTYSLFSSFARHRDALARRWRSEGDRALKSGHPKEAINDLHSALEYAPGQRDLEIELATALAAAGNYRESAAYFNSLLEAQPGNGYIHLQLARLAAKQNNPRLAEEHYQRALDGTWEGDGYLRRLSVRLELARYLTSQKDFSHAQTQLRTAAGNAPDEPETQLQIAALMGQAQDPEDAFQIYLSQMQHKGAPLEAFEGAGRTAYLLGRFGTARDALARAVDHPQFAVQDEDARNSVKQMLEDSIRILQLYPDPNLNVRALAGRILANSNIARARFSSCLTDASAAGKLANLQTRWQQIPANLTVRALEQDPQMEQTIMSLVYDTERQTAQLCGVPSGDDALLLKIAQSPMAVQQQ